MTEATATKTRDEGRDNIAIWLGATVMLAVLCQVVFLAAMGPRPEVFSDEAWRAERRAALVETLALRLMPAPEAAVQEGTR